MGLVRVSGTWRDAEPYVRVSNAWRLCESEHVRVGGAWRETWKYFPFEFYTIGTGSYGQQLSDRFVIYAQAQGEFLGGEAIAVTKESVSLTGVNQITIDWQGVATERFDGAVIAVTPNKTDPPNEADRRYGQINATFPRMTSTLYVGDLSGNYYIQVWAFSSADEGRTPPFGGTELTVYSIALDGNKIYGQ